MHKRTLFITTVSGLALALVFGGPTDRAQAQQVDASKPIEERVALLERVLVRDVTNQDKTVLARLEKIESVLQIDAKKRKEGEEADAKTFDDLKANYLKAQREFESYDRRLRAMEAKNLDDLSDDLTKDVKALRRDVDSHATMMREMNDRLRRVESKVR